MLKDRRIQVLLGLLAAQIILVAVIYWPRPTQAGGGALFPNLSANDVSELTITDAEGKAITLARAGDGWVLPQAGAFPARTEAVAALVEKLVGLKSNRLITETPASHARLQVAATAFMRRIEFKTGGETHTIFLGSAPAAGATHFRLDGQDQVYQTSALTAFDANTSPASYIDASLVSIPAADVSAMTVKNTGGTLTFSKGADGQWTLAELPAGQTLDVAQVQTLLNQATSLSMVEPLGKVADPAWGLDSPQAVLTLVTRPAEGEGKTYELRIGAKDEANSRYYVKFSESPYFVAVPSFNLDEIVSKTASAFVATPTPTPTE